MTWDVVKVWESDGLFVICIIVSFWSVLTKAREEKQKTEVSAERLVLRQW